MITLLETTDWEFPNHAYMVDDSKSKLLGYTRRSDGHTTIFHKPLPFDIRNRTFTVLAQEPVYDKKVIGSKGDVYYIIDGKCSCTGFKYHGRCKHV